MSFLKVKPPICFINLNHSIKKPGVAIHPVFIIILNRNCCITLIQKRLAKKRSFKITEKPNNFLLNNLA